MKVLKFGSATIANVEKIRYIASLISQQQDNIIVLSSMQGVAKYLEEISKYFYNKNTEGAIEVLNKLEIHYKDIINSLYKKDTNKDKAFTLLESMTTYIRAFSEELFTLFEERALMAQGEIISVSLISLYLEEEEGVKNHILSALDFMRMDRNEAPDSPYIKENLKNLLSKAPEKCVYLTQGYICRNSYGEVDDLHKGGSDYTAAIIGAAINAQEIQIWADTDVMLNIDSEYIENAKIVRKLSFDEAAELAYFGTKILHPTCVLPAKLAGVPIRLMNTRNPEDKGTVIFNDTEQGTIKAIGTRDGITAINIKSGKMLLAHGFLRRIFEVFEKYQTSIDMLATSEIGISVTIDNCKNLEQILDELKNYGIVSTDKNMVIISIVGDLVIENDKSNILDALKSIPIRMISYGGSNLNFSFLIDKTHKEKTLHILNDKLFN